MKLHYTETSTALKAAIGDEKNPVCLLTRTGVIHDNPNLHNGKANCFTIPTSAVGNGFIFKPAAVVEFKRNLLDEAKSRYNGVVGEKVDTKKNTKKKAMTKEERKHALAEAKGSYSFNGIEEAFIAMLIEVFTIDEKEFKLPDGYKDETELKQEKVDMFLQEHLIGLQHDSVHDWIVKEREALEYKDRLQRVVGSAT